MKLFKIIKINLLALLAFPLLLLAFAAQMAAKAMKKAIAVIGAVLVVFMIGLLFELVRNFGQAMEIIMILIVCLVLGGILFAIILFLLSAASAVIMAAVGVAIGLMEGIYSVSYSGYSSLFYKCRSGYEELCEEGSPFLCGLFCFVFTLIRIVNRVIIFLMTHALKILAVLCAALAVGGVYQINRRIVDIFGIGLPAYLKLFSAFDIVYGVVLYAAVMGAIAVILISLGREWNEWAREMLLSTSHYEEYAKSVQDQWQEVRMDYGEETEEEDNRRERCMAAAKLLDQHIQTFDAFVEEVSPVADEGGDYMLRSEMGEYAGILQEISEKLGEYDGEVPLEVFEKYIRKIKEADDLKNSIRRRIEKARASQAESRSSGGFFAGCDTEAKLEKRYKALCRTYHPDNESGDEETFKAVQAEYESRKKAI